MTTPLTLPTFLLGSPGAATPLRPQAAHAEQRLLQAYSEATLPERFVHLDGLNELYFLNRRNGGMAGRAWVEGTRNELVRTVQEEERYCEFVRIPADGPATIDLPAGLPPPSMLRFSEEWGRPSILFLGGSSSSAAVGTHAYFELSALCFLSPQVGTSEMELSEKRLREGQREVVIASPHFQHRDRILVAEGATVALSTHRADYPYVLGKFSHPGVWPKRVYRIQDISVGELKIEPAPTASSAPLAPIPAELTFVPNRDPQIWPVKVVLKRQGRPYPVIIEKLKLDQAHEILPPDLFCEFDHRMKANSPERLEPFVRVLRTLDGTAHAVSMSFLVRNGNEVRMRSDRLVKSDQEKGSQIEGVGLAFLISALRFMKRMGYWPEKGPLIYNLIPQVSQALRRHAGLQKGLTREQMSLDTDVITAAEAEAFLAVSRLSMEELV